MFMGNLSSVQERKARSKKTDDNGKKSVSEEKVVKTKVDSKVALGPPGGPLLHTAESGSVPRDILLDYLNTCAAMLLNDEHLRMCIEIHLNAEPDAKLGLHQCLMEFQKQVMENNFAIERNFGCRYMSMIPSNFPEDTTLHASAKRFMFICMRAYVNASRLRYREYFEGKKEIKSSGELPRSDMLEFFESCNALMAMPETKKALKEAYIATGEPPAEKVMEIQRNVFKEMCYDVDWACSKMNTIPTKFQDDMELITKMEQFQVAAELAVQEATMTDADRNIFYESIPSFMHHFPHMFVWQQRRQMMMEQHQRAMLAKNGGGHDHGHDHSHDHGHSHSHGQHALSPEEKEQMEERKQWMAYINSKEGQDSLTQLSSRIQTAKSAVQGEVAGWDVEAKLDYFDKFGGEIPDLLSATTVMDRARSTATAIRRIDAFNELSNPDLEKIMKLQCIVESDLKSGDGALQARIDELTKNSIFQGMRTNMMGTPSLGGSDHATHPSNEVSSHSHNHSHSHDHGSFAGDNPDPRSFYGSAHADLTQGKVETMDR